jgi:lycopene beta-cyclase
VPLISHSNPIIIVGGGLAGALTALVLSRTRPDLPVLLLEAGENFGGNHTWSFFDGDIPQDSRYWIEALHPWHSPRHRVSFPRYDRLLDQGYNSIEAKWLDALVRERLAPDSWRCHCAVAELAPGHVILKGGEKIHASAVIDARGPEKVMPGLELGWQKFVGIEYADERPAEDCATIMDATVPQFDGYRFVYTLPLARDRVLLEDTYYSDNAELDVPAVTARVRAAAAERGITGAELRHEQGVLPITIGGDPDVFWPTTDPVARIGIRGGFFHATTGYSLPLAIRTALQLGEQRDFSAPALAAWSRRQFTAHWKQSAYYRLLNRMMFHAAAPDQRYRIFERFYGLSEPLITRFYSGNLTARDKARLLAGRPPVPLGAAIRVLLQSS